ncbi:multiple inositol-polyphosphate phosphatase / 2,3-bisphosphoglycerate 3-phosphatase [Mytilus galloprovincialis]|uniref:Multiple inositol polyphosphate phosphatase 1 n=2 Tax=Mytilus galloprovincialis TaxID=29158 RepID=A0A8B6EBP9_MYTGA|nr:multiple inositol-polyphosphate phosphatase / 2,3-bisphosphoglycerate 3-phosphatase [Mytilus galloprovincialis]
MDSLLFLILCLLSLFIANYGMGSTDFRIPLYSTKTPYFWGKDIDEFIREDEEIWVDYDNKECQIIHLNLILRHGSRSPTLSWIKKMTVLGNILKSNPEVIERFPFLNSWENPFPETRAGHLSDLGEDEHFSLGRRFGRRFSLLFTGDLENILYGVTYKQRTQASCASFYEGLTDTLDGESRKNVKPAINDKLLRFFDTCSKYIKSVENNKTAAPEHTSFKYGAEMQRIAQKIADKLGLKTLNSEEAQTIHHLCAFELALFDKSDWCDMLEKEDLFIFEYLYDLKQYWKRGYGHSVNWGMSCPFNSNVFKQLNDVIYKARNGEDYNVADIQFAHAETIIPIFTAFGLFNDSVPLKADNYESQKERQFRTSKIVPMSASFGIGLYQCEASEDPEEVYVVRMFVNEKPVVIPACGQEICEYKQFMKYYDDLVNCNYAEICENNKPHDEL